MRSRAVALLALIALLPTGTRAQDVAKPEHQPEASGSAAAGAPSDPADLVAVNTLQADGKRPFHLVMGFQVFDLGGKPEEQGTIEYWWAGDRGFLLNITAPSLGTVHNVRFDEVAKPGAKRTLFFANQLLDSERFAGSLLKGRTGETGMVERAFGKLKLNCTGPLPTAGAPFIQDTVCLDEQSGTVRLIEGPGFVITRNRPGLFAGTHVALEEEILWGHVPSIKGHIDKLESFEPASNAVALEHATTPEESKTKPSTAVMVAGGVIAGKKISGAQPQYPERAKQARLKGTVLLAAEISKQGRIAYLIPLASPDPLLTDAAMNAVSEWVYQPYLLNGAPVSVDTTITINFNLSSGR